MNDDIARKRRSVGESSEDDARLERFANDTFERNAAALDATERARLAQARHRALEAAASRRPALGLRRRERPLLAAPGIGAAGAVAATVAAIALIVSVALRQDMPKPADAVAQLAALDDFDMLTGGDMLAGGDELDMLEDDLEFYAWLEQQPEIAGGDGAAAGDGENGDG